MRARRRGSPPSSSLKVRKKGEVLKDNNVRSLIPRAQRSCVRCIVSTRPRWRMHPDESVTPEESENCHVPAETTTTSAPRNSWSALARWVSAWPNLSGPFWCTAAPALSHAPDALAGRRLSFTGRSHYIGESRRCSQYDYFRLRDRSALASNRRDYEGFSRARARARSLHRRGSSVSGLTSRAIYLSSRLEWRRWHSRAASSRNSTTFRQREYSRGAILVAVGYPWQRPSQSFISEIVVITGAYIHAMCRDETSTRLKQRFDNNGTIIRAASVRGERRYLTTKTATCPKSRATWRIQVGDTNRNVRAMYGVPASKSSA